MKYLLTLIVIFLTACHTSPTPIKPHFKVRSCTGDIDLYVISHGWHTGFAVRAADLNALIPELALRFPHKQFYEIGWGDAGFYQANQITTGLTLRAMFWSSGSVVHIVSFNENPSIYFEQSTVQLIKTNPDAYNSLLQFIKTSLKTDNTQRIIKENKGIYGDSQFYTGIGNYHLFNTCNKWTAKGLYSAGLDINPLLKLTSSSVMTAVTNFCSTNNISSSK